MKKNQQALSPLNRITTPLIESKKIEVWVKRDDLIHSPFPGNKHRKLLPHIEHAQEIGAQTIISCGGAFSNHLYALSFVPEKFNLNLIAFIRGEINDPLNPNFQLLNKKGIELRPILRSEYSQVFSKMNALANQLEDAYVIPEGGTDIIGIGGMSPCYHEIVSELGEEPDYLITPIGSGGTMAGLIHATQRAKVIGVMATKGQGALEDAKSKISSLLQSEDTKWEILKEDKFGSFGSMNQALFDTSINIWREWNTMPDPIYTNRSFGVVMELIQQDYFEPGKKIVCLHTGGLQGWSGMKYRYSSKFEFDEIL